MLNCQNSNVREDYNKNGFYIFRGVLDKALISDIKNEIFYITKQQLTELGYHTPKGLADALKLLFSLDMTKYLYVVSTCCRLRSINKLFASEAVDILLGSLKVTNVIMPTHPVFHIMSESLRVPGGYFGLKAHQDWPSMQGSLDSFVIWVPLINIDRHSNPLELVPGSHLKGIIPSSIGGNESVINSDFYHDGSYIPVEVDECDVAIVSTFTVHRSAKKSSPIVRLACSQRFENIDENTYVKRGYPTAYQRSVNRENLGFKPTEEDVSNIFI
jgi:ectoine hydroxylase-related dioxygenase (phytanoyl-CoA dioxygenase family)